MPIGKNAIKRVTNNGYSKVETSAPDMENSVINEEKEATAEKKKPTAKKTAVKKSTEFEGILSEPKKVSSKKTTTPKKSMETEPELSPVKTLEKVAKAETRQGDGYVNIGGDMPYYLL